MNVSEYKIQNPIRTVNYGNLAIGGDTSVSFMSENGNKTKTLFALEVLYNIEENYPPILKDLWSGQDFFERLATAQKSSADLISIKFNITEDNLENKIAEICKTLTNFPLSTFHFPLILRGANNKNIDKYLLPALAQNAPRESIIAFADDNTYEEIAAATAKYNHILVLRSPIDINLAKELNILASDKGMSLDRLLIDPDMGGLGYGLDYGFSIVEKIKESGFAGDTMLNMPIIVFAGEEAFKAKEAKSSNFDKCWGEYSERALMWEIATAAPMISAGANIVVLWHPKSIDTLKGVLV